MTTVKAYAVKCTDTLTGQSKWLHCRGLQKSIHGALFKNKKTAERYLDCGMPHEKIELVEIDITIKD